MVDQINEQEESENLEPVLLTEEKDSVPNDTKTQNSELTTTDMDFSGVQYITMPRLSDTMEEGTISSWEKKVGDEVDEVIFFR